jgi:hypothetical protein
MYFNTKRKRAGHLLQGRYKAILVNANEYAKELSRYIHLNPVRAGIEKNPDEYEWSSCRYYTIKRKAPEWLQREFILRYFAKRLSIAMEKYRGFIESVMEREYKSPLSARLHSVILGSQAFVDEIKASFLKNRRSERELPDLNETPKKIGLAEIDKAEKIGVGPKNWVAVGMPVTRHPPHRSVHDGSPSYGSDLEYLASNRSHGRGWQLGAHQPICPTLLPGPESGQWASDRRSSWWVSFPPQTPQKITLPCAPASSVLCCHPTS